MQIQVYQSGEEDGDGEVESETIRTALESAILAGHIESVQALLELGADITTPEV